MTAVVAPTEVDGNVRPWQDALGSRSAEVDALIEKTAAEWLGGSLTGTVALAAVGGYGRRELFPHSDIDILLVANSDAALAKAKEPFSFFLRSLWDAGLRVSQSAHTISDCCELNEQNIELHISLLDLRFLSGSRAMFDNLGIVLESFYPRHKQPLIRNLAEMARSRHSKFNNTIFHLEPNIKEAPGGMRDIHFLHWLNRLSPGNEALEQALHESDSVRGFLYPLRIFLHNKAGRDNNLLTFELQDEAAKVLGKGAVPEEWMRLYYLAARRTWQAARRALEFTESLDRSLLRQFRDRRSRLSTTNYTVSNDRVLLRNPQEITLSAEAIFRLFTFCARHGFPLAWDAQRRLLLDSEKIAGAFQTNPPNWVQWRELLSLPHASLALQQMQETGVLSMAVPEWRAVDGLVVRDFYHRYTVDEHTLVAVGVVDEIAKSSGDEAKRISQLFAEVEDPAILRFALLLHDVGKGTMPGDHVRGSLDSAEAVMERFNVPIEQRRTIDFLIRHHLDLSQIMNGRDLDDPTTARSLAAQMGTLENLRYLTLFTYADISAVNATAMTPWRLEQLWRVYAVGQEQLTRELETSRIRGFEDLPEVERTPGLAKFLRGLPTRYLRTHSEDDVLHHAELYCTVREKQVAVEIYNRKGSFQATILAMDKPGLFSSLCGALASFGMNIVKAEAFNNDAGLAVDEFRFTDPLRNLELNPPEVDRLRKTIERVVLGTDDVRFLLQRRRAVPRPSRASRIAPAVRFNNQASESATLVDFIGEDRPGLLYDLASVFASLSCNIEIVLIDTEGHKAVDVFYVTRDGQKLDEAAQQELRAALLKAADRTSAA